MRSDYSNMGDFVVEHDDKQQAKLNGNGSLARKQ